MFPVSRRWFTGLSELDLQFLREWSCLWCSSLILHCEFHCLRLSPIYALLKSQNKITIISTQGAQKLRVTPLSRGGYLTRTFPSTFTFWWCLLMNHYAKSHQFSFWYSLKKTCCQYFHNMGLWHTCNVFFSSLKRRSERRSDEPQLWWSLRNETF